MGNNTRDLKAESRMEQRQYFLNPWNRLMIAVDGEPDMTVECSLTIMREDREEKRSFKHKIPFNYFIDYSAEAAKLKREYDPLTGGERTNYLLMAELQDPRVTFVVTAPGTVSVQAHYGGKVLASDGGVQDYNVAEISFKVPIDNVLTDDKH